MDYFETKVDQWSDWEAVRRNAMTFTPLIKQIYSSENEPFKTPEVVETPQTATFMVGPSEITIFPPSNVAPDTRDRYQTERFSLTRMARLQQTAPVMLHAGFIFDSYQFYYVIYQPLAGVSLNDFATTAEPLAKSTLARQIGTALNRINGEVNSFNHVDCRQAADTADWAQFGTQLVAERTELLKSQPLTANDFVHGQLTGENLVVTSGQVGLQHFATAVQAPKQVELVPVILDAFKGDPDLMAGFTATFNTADLVNDLLLGLLWRADGPQYIQRIMAGQPVTLAAIRANLTALVHVK